VFTSVEKTPITASYNLLNVSDTTYDSPENALNPTSESSSPPTDPLNDPVCMEEHILKSDNDPKSPVEGYEKLAHLPASQGVDVVCRLAVSVHVHNYFCVFVEAIYSFSNSIGICLGAENLPPSIYDTLDEESLRNHYEFPDKDDGM